MKQMQISDKNTVKRGGYHAGMCGLKNNLVDSAEFDKPDHRCRSPYAMGCAQAV